MNTNLHSILVFILVVSLAVLAGCSKSNSEQSEEITKYVKLEEVNGGKNVERLLFNGTIMEKSLISLSFRVGGPLVSLGFEEGDRVKAGETIAIIDDRDYLLNVQSTRAQFQQLEGEYGRYKALLQRKKVPANSYEKVESGYLMSKTAYENAKNQLVDTKLKSPINGYIHEKYVENFQTVAAGQPVVSVIDLSILEVLINVSESQLLTIRDAKESYVSVKNANVSGLPVQVSMVGEKAKNDGLFEVKYTLRNEGDLRVFPGMSAEVTVNRKSQNGLVNVSSGAILHQNGRDYVWVYDARDKIVNKREVQMKAIASGGKVELSAGLSPGELIVSAGVYFLFDKQRVTPLNPPSETNKGGLL